MKLSIITATYNSQATIASCMASLVQQSYQAIEYVIVDGNSSDDTLEIVKQYQLNYPHVAFKITSEPDLGIYDALNKGIAQATGAVIGFVHSDDVLASNTILSEIAQAFQNKALDGVYGDLQYVAHSNTNQVIRYWKSRSFHPKLLKQGWMPAHPTLFLKRGVYEKYGNFDTSYKIAADYDFMLRILKEHTLKFLYLPQVITKMRVGGMSNRSVKNIIQKSKEDYRAVTSNKVGGLLSVLRKNTSKIKQFI
ncbi:glycosyltransferase family 2 protein [Gaetbulibacter aquiaggeris]|uniref:Glycosyltransferase family 2 protein n=1 Tax=Gaetbulibacter aquiaggeris TaxID=1735373 RepID=A0ABW7MRX1_9FLAO